MGYPTGSVYRLLLLTGLRLNEAAQISWPEIQGNAIEDEGPGGQGA
jgi:integrase